MAASECMSQQASGNLPLPMCSFRCWQSHAVTCGLPNAQAILHGRFAPGADRGELHNRPFRRQLPGFSPMLIEWLKEGWLLASAQMQHSELRSGVLLLALLHSPLRYIPPRCCPSADGHKPRPVTAGFRSMDKGVPPNPWIWLAGKRPAQRKPATPCPARYKT